MTAIVRAAFSKSYPTTTGATTDSTFIYKKGYSFGTVTNPSSANRAIAYYHVVSTSTGQSGPWPLYDQDGVQVTQTVVAEQSWELHSACAGCDILVPVTAAAASTMNLIFHFEG